MNRSKEDRRHEVFDCGDEGLPRLRWALDVKPLRSPGQNGSFIGFLGKYDRNVESRKEEKRRPLCPAPALGLDEKPTE